MVFFTEKDDQQMYEDLDECFKMEHKSVSGCHLLQNSIYLFANHKKRLYYSSNF